MRSLIILFCLILFSCNNKNRNIVDVSNLNEKIHIEMSKNEIIQKFGKPKDSLFNDLAHPKEYPYYYVYDTNNFSGYTLKIFFDSENKVSRYLLD